MTLNVLNVSLSSIVLAVATASSSGVFADDRVEINAREQWSNLFSDQPAEFHFAINARQHFKGRAMWTLSIGRRTVAQEEAAIAAEPAKPAELLGRLPPVPVKNGVVVQAQLAISVFADAGAKPEATADKTLWIFPANPFVDRTQWLKELKITLFDPREATAGLLQKLNVPFEETRNLASVGEMNDGVLVIGEGISLRDYRELPEVMFKAAARGVSVVCLAPADGLIPIPGSAAAELPAPKSISWRRQDVITELDKRLDAAAWPAHGKVVASSLVLKADAGAVVAEVVREQAGWPWLEARFSAKRGTLVVCGFAIVEAWEHSPTPRYVLSRLLEHVSADPQKAQDELSPSQGESRHEN